MSPFQFSIILCSPSHTPCSWRKKKFFSPSHLFHIFSCSGDWRVYMRRGKKFVSHFPRWIGTRGVSSGSKGDWPVKNTWFWLSWWVCTTFISKFNFSMHTLVLIDILNNPKHLSRYGFNNRLTWNDWTCQPGRKVRGLHNLRLFDAQQFSSQYFTPYIHYSPILAH